MKKSSYVIVSACRNEEKYIDGLIQTIVDQKHRPLRWIIVDDGSTDNTFEYARLRTKDYSFIQIVQMPGGRPRSFTSQVYAAQHGYELAKLLNFDFIGFLDADIRLQPDYYERLLELFQANAELGLAGGEVIDQYQGRTDNIRQGSEHFHVAGGVQFFRRTCFERIGGYTPIQGGGQDTIADVMVMMNGWKVQTFHELPAIHLRPEGFTNDKPFQKGIKWGRKFYLLGYHPFFYVGQCVRRLPRRPILVNSLCQLLGFAMANIKREPRPVPEEFVKFIRQLQMRRFRQMIGLNPASPYVRSVPQSEDQAVL
jgi:glycosyltransferase involved in cell wall biosynthesis